MLAAAREARAGGAEPPFQLRPGLVPAIVSFYDELLRQEGTVDSFERLVVADLEPSAELDRGARRLLRQTRFPRPPRSGRFSGARPGRVGSTSTACAAAPSTRVSPGRWSMSSPPSPTTRPTRTDCGRPTSTCSRVSPRWSASTWWPRRRCWPPASTSA